MNTSAARSLRSRPHYHGGRILILRIGRNKQHDGSVEQGAGLDSSL